MKVLSSQNFFNIVYNIETKTVQVWYSQGGNECLQVSMVVFVPIEVCGVTCSFVEGY